MKKWLVGLVIALAWVLYVGMGQRSAPSPDTSALSPSSVQQGQDAIRAAFAQRRSGLQVLGEGRVVKLLPDDNDGSRHQRFLIELPGGPTLLVAHNIDLAPRLDALQQGDTVAFHGVYEWNAKGGVIHWTHHDPRGQHTAGWLKHQGKTVQ